MSILVYLIISLVLFLIGYPLTSNLKKIKLGKWKMNDGFASLLTLLVFFAIFYLFFILVFPPLIREVSFISKLNFYDVVNEMLAQYPSVKEIVAKLGSEHDIKVAANEQLTGFFNFGTISTVVNNVFSYMSAFLGGTFCVLFITFFLLKDEQMVSRTILLLTPERFDAEMKDVLKTSKKMLSKYFTGLLIDVLIVGVLTGLAFYFLGIRNALIIGFMAGLFNVIPYIGPIITICFALFMGVSGCIEQGAYDLITTTVTKIIVTLLSINLLDTILIQPFIFSNTVKAHPLEIFIVVLMAGTLGGITGMVVAIPVYTLIRIIAREFLTHHKFFKKLSENISEE
jgi:predicted PurR-regulated permease PerM